MRVGSSVLSILSARFSIYEVIGGVQHDVSANKESFKHSVENFAPQLEELEIWELRAAGGV